MIRICIKEMQGKARQGKAYCQVRVGRNDRKRKRSEEEKEKRKTRQGKTRETKNVRL